MSDEDFYEEDSSSEDDHEDSDDKAEGFVKTYNFLKTFEQRHKNSTGQKEYLEENDVLIGPDHHSKENTSFENRLERKSCEIENDKSDHENSDQKHLISDQQTAENHIITEKKKKVHCIEIIDSDDECDQEEISLDHTNVEQSDKKEKLVCEAERNQVELSENSINQDSSKELLSDKICNEKDQESTSNDICGSDVAIQSLKDQDLNVAKMKDHYLLMKYYEKKMNEEKELLEKIQLEKEQLGENDCLEDELSHSDVVEAKIQELKQQGKLESEEQFLRKRALKRKVADSGLDAFSKEKLNHKDKEITQYIPKEHGNKGYENMSDEYGKQNLRLDKERNRQTLMDVGLANEKKQNIAEHFLHQRKYAQSTLHKHAWVLRLYDYFAEDMDFKPFPMSLECVRGFIRFLAYDCRYCVYSIYAVVLPSLKRIQVKMYNKPIDVQLNTELNLIVNEMRRDKSLKQKGEGKEPLMTFDVKYLVQSIPDFFMSKAEECSLFLFALHTGARAITCGNVRLCDVRQVIIEDDSIFLKIRLMRNKGNDKWNHIVLLENQTEENKSLDAVYWMRQHILQKFGKDLFLKEEWPLKEKSEELIWSWSSETMRTRLKKRLELAAEKGKRWKAQFNGHV
ncbi:uncharacterized protein MONOS_15979 [Monocercomonoides exilis]|uniref:uncharacterized protein n=1 Tax=Monocercomonoides exilis TaxID=2049356 RepID=UPI00355A3EAD|nr:hypothetical protein MONOS_15979 [Monocercomonoides exilis]|eukprot:MONOS_15979.1-p1 / transcript=MONOS_15979.1 / gene=MONOS_15979 / organism=Monocercomonoides_exilis_PA203 / gene_product=unspecified product / transcript_product=unspecified product / location=Mono_scaffold01440:6432-8656(+) / protein_length=625 / sequence_SO=supercontig / SO=protein_coding / is_pseudo=false